MTDTNELLQALERARQNFKPIHKDGYNPHFKSRFATLNTIKSAVDEALAQEGLTILQFPSESNGHQPALTTVLAHVPSGQSISYTTPLALSKNDPQAQGSAITYMRRYAYSAVLNLVTDDDDDGNVASGPEPRREEKPRQQRDNPDLRAALGGVISEAKRVGLDRETTTRLFQERHGENLDNTRNVKALKAFKESLPQLVAEIGLGAKVVE